METMENYEFFQHQKSLLQGALQKAGLIFDGLNMDRWSKTGVELLERLSSNIFKLLVLGEFKRGKSTFINALLGEEVLPAFATPTTAVINEISWGEAQRVTVFFKNPLPNPLPDTLSPEMVHLFRTHGGQTPPPKEIKVSALEEFVSIPDPAKDHCESVAETPFEKVVIEWPLALLKNGIQIIDSPGLNEHNTRTKVTMDYLGDVDAVLFVLSAISLAGQSELDVIDKSIRGSSHEDIFFVVNRFDQVAERERDRLVAYGREKLKTRTSFKDQGVFFISALAGLEGRLSGDEAKVKASNLPDLEEKLSKFLTRDRARVKLGQPARHLMQGLQEAIEVVIPNQRALLRQGLDALQKRYDEVKPQFDAAKRSKEQTVTKLNTRLDLFCHSLRTETRNWVNRFANSLPTAFGGYEPENKIKFFTMEGPAKQIEKLSEELIESTKQKMELAFKGFKEETLDPLLRKELEMLGQALKSDTEALIRQIEGIMVRLTGGNLDEAPVKSGVERTIATVIGTVLGGIGSGTMGFFGGYSEMAKSLLPQIGLGLGMMILGVVNPLVIVPVLLGAGVIQGLMTQGATTKKIQARLVEKIAMEIRLSAQDEAERVANKIHQKLRPIANRFDQEMDRQIASVQNQVQAALDKLNQGQAETDRRILELDEIASDIGKLNAELTGFCFSLNSIHGE